MWKKILLIIIVIIFIVASYWYYQQETYQHILRNTFDTTTTNTQAIPNQLLTNQLASNPYNMKSSFLENIYEGTVIEWNIYNENSSFYGAQITLRGKNNNTNTFLIKGNEMPILKAEELHNGQKVMISLSEIKPGDIVTIHEKIDMLKPWGENRMEFTVISNQ